MKRAVEESGERESGERNKNRKRIIEKEESGEEERSN